MIDCPKCCDTGWRLLPTVAPTDALPCDRCDTPPSDDADAVMAAHGFVALTELSEDAGLYDDQEDT